MVQTAAVEIPADLSFDRTVRRDLVHRLSNTEVFLTDYRKIEGGSYFCAAQLPRYHAYYNEGLAQSAAYDILLLLECCRQAATYGGHAYFGNASATTNLVKGIDISVTHPEALDHTDRPGELLMHVTAIQVTSEGRQKSGTLVVDMFVDGRLVGRARIAVTVVPQGTFTALRRRQRGTESLPSTDELPEIPPGVPVLPARVGRLNPTNVLLTDAAVEGRSVVARVGLSCRNHSILDHRCDHLPAMALIEAGRQACLLAPDPASAADTTRLTGLTANFTQVRRTGRPVARTGDRPGLRRCPRQGGIERAFHPERAGSRMGRLHLHRWVRARPVAEVVRTVRPSQS